MIYEIIYFTVSWFSRFTNRVFFKGTMHQTLSARAHIEARTSYKWAKREYRINRLFRILTLGRQKNHCQVAHTGEVKRAFETLRLNGDKHLLEQFQ